MISNKNQVAMWMVGELDYRNFGLDATCPASMEYIFDKPMDSNEWLKLIEELKPIVMDLLWDGYASQGRVEIIE